MRASPSARLMTTIAIVIAIAIGYRLWRMAQPGHYRHA
jgi:hypothetical protein